LGLGEGANGLGREDLIDTVVYKVYYSINEDAEPASEVRGKITTSGKLEYAPILTFNSTLLIHAAQPVGAPCTEIKTKTKKIQVPLCGA
jgi:hypothetical protein